MTLNYTADITAAVDSGGTLTMLRYAKKGFRTLPSDTPPHVFYASRIKQPASLRRDMFNGGTSGRSNISWGALVVSNKDGGLDAIKDYGFDGRDCIIRVGDEGAAFPAGYTTFIRATIEQAALSWSDVSFQLRDRLMNFDKPILQATYGGTNLLPFGLDGVAQDIKGQRRPKAYGRVLNVVPPCVNTARLIYEVGACQSVDAVYDQGLALTKGTDYLDQADMEGNAPAAGYFRSWPAGGYLRIGSKAVGPLTADVTNGATVADRTVARLLKKIALDMGIDAGDISAADVASLDSTAAYETGIWLSDDTTALSAMDQLAASVGAWYGFDRLGILRMGQLAAPTGNPVATFTPSTFKDLTRISSTSLEQALPTWRVTVNYAKNYNVSASGLAGAVTADRAAWLALERRAALFSNADVKKQYLNASEITRDTLLLNEADALAEAARLGAIFGVKRETYTIRVYVKSVLDATGVDLGSVIQIVAPRFGLNAGKKFIVIGIQADLAKNSLDLTVWG